MEVVDLLSPTNGKPLERIDEHSLSDGEIRWPLVEGIAWLRSGKEELRQRTIDALDAGEVEEATAGLLADQDAWARTPAPPIDVCRRTVAEVTADDLSLRSAMAALAFGPVGDYFAYRWSDPTFLSGLALLGRHWPADGPILELGCGIGHYLQALRQAGREVVGGDVVFAKLWLARRYVVPDATLVCFDAGYDFPLPSASVGGAFCHDAFYFLPEKQHVAHEMRRVAGDEGTVLVGHAHNSMVDNLSAGDPRTPAQYAEFIDATSLYDDDDLTASFLTGMPAIGRTADELSDAPAVAVVAGAARPGPTSFGMPAIGALLRRNPLLDQRGRVVWPSNRYEQEYASRSSYLTSPPPALPISAKYTAELEPVVRRRLLLALPEQW